VAVAVCAPRIVLPAKTIGALADHVLILPTSPHEIQYALPSEILPGVGTLWRYCEAVGLDLPSDEAHTAWFSKNVGFETFAVPSQFGVKFSKSALAEAAWFVLAKSNLLEVIPEFLDMSFRLEAANGNWTGQQMAAIFASRWEVGIGLFQATRIDKRWLLPQCLRWIVRELAAAQEASVDSPIGLPLNSEAELILDKFFPGFLEGVEFNVVDAFLAAWFLHEDFNGLADTRNEQSDPLVLLTILSRGVVNVGSEFEVLSRWSSIWGVDDGHPMGNGWNGMQPSELRALFVARHSIELKDFLKFSISLLIWQTVRALKGESFRLELTNILGLGFDEALTVQCLEILNEIAVAWPSLGQEVLRSTSDYKGLGSTSQMESSTTWNYPIVVMPDGRLCLSNARAFATRVVKIIPESIARQLGEGQFRSVQGVVGRMFEAYGSNVVARMGSRYTVLLGDEIDQLVPVGCKRGDAVIASVSDIVVLDFSLLSAVDQTMEGNRQSIDDTLQRYVAKFSQTAKTPVTEFLKPKIPQLGSSRFSFIVVCEDPLLTTPLHQALNPNPDLGVPSHYAISMADLELLADLTDRGIDPSSLLGSWQRSTARESFSTVLHRVQRLQPSASGSIESSLGRVFRDTK
jgi:hypothetical protein